VPSFLCDPRKEIPTHGKDGSPVFEYVGQAVDLPDQHRLAVTTRIDLILAGTQLAKKRR
jgi:hypothetical protein